MERAVFLDRDGVVNVDTGYVSTTEDFEFIDGIFDACRDFQIRGYKLIVITNQSGIARGYFSPEKFENLCRWMSDQFLKNGVTINAIYHCPHHPKEGFYPFVRKCDCRKPAPGMFLRAIEEHNINPIQSIMIGDKESDMEAAANAGIGCKILLKSKSGHRKIDPSLADFVWSSFEGRKDLLL